MFVDVGHHLPGVMPPASCTSHKQPCPPPPPIANCTMTSFSAPKIDGKALPSTPARVSERGGRGGLASRAVWGCECAEGVLTIEFPSFVYGFCFVLFRAHISGQWRAHNPRLYFLFLSYLRPSFGVGGGWLSGAHTFVSSLHGVVQSYRQRSVASIFVGFVFAYSAVVRAHMIAQSGLAHHISCLWSLPSDFK